MTVETKRKQSVIPPATSRSRREGMPLCRQASQRITKAHGMNEAVGILAIATSVRAAPQSQNLYGFGLAIVDRIRIRAAVSKIYASASQFYKK